MSILSIVLFAVALSFDGFGVGIAYGIKKIRIPLKSLIVISLTSSTAIGFSMLLGSGLTHVISIIAAERIGAVILVIMGGWLLFQSLLSQEEQIIGKSPETSAIGFQAPSPMGILIEEPLFRIQIKPLGLVVQILRQPVKADLDHSGIISPKEAIFLGLALAMDALGAGIGAAMAGFSILITLFVVGMVKFCLVSFGGFVGRRFCASWLGNWASFIPGIVLILLGLANFKV